MSVLVLDQHVAEAIKAKRIQDGSARWDEVWDGVYVMSPLPNNEHQELVSWLDFIFRILILVPGLGRVFPGANVSDRDDDWMQNFRCPDIAIFLRGGTAKDRDTHWFGGPDFAVEIVSRHDRVHEKIAFYEAVGVRELLVIDRNPWALELYRLEGGTLRSAGRSTAEQSVELASTIVPLSLRLAPGEGRPRIEATRLNGPECWSF